MRTILLLAAIVAGIIALQGFSAVEAVAQQKLVVSAADCRWLVRHQPAPDVTYQPGVDVRGKAVAPADLNGGYPQIKVPDEITFEITAELKEYLTSALSGRFAGETVVGRVTVKGDRVYFNDQLVGDAAAHAIAEECKRMQQEDGQ